VPIIAASGAFRQAQRTRGILFIRLIRSTRREMASTGALRPHRLHILLANPRPSCRSTWRSRPKAGALITQTGGLRKVRWRVGAAANAAA
jgi:hypothetical protein